MKILLTTLNAKYVHSNLALRYLYETGRRAGLSAEELTMAEFTINNESGYVYGEILRGQYDLVCFSCYIWNIRQTCDLAADLKKAQPGLTILLGGPEVSYEAEDFLTANPHVDGVLLRDNGPGEAWEMAALPFPYLSVPPAEDKVVYYEASRGCPYRCSYCLSSLEKTIRPLPLARTQSELSWFLQRRVRQVKFIDRTFNYDRERAKKIWQFLIDNDNGITNFHFEICAELLDDSCLEVIAAARPGLFQFEIGIQSCNPKTLRAADRSGDTDRTLTRIRQLVNLKNSHIHVDLIAGLPYEDYESFGRSFEQVYGLGADNLQLGFLKLLKGTRIQQRREEFGYICRDYAPYQVIASRWLTALEMERLSMIETVLELYHNKGGFSRTLEFLIDEAFGGRAFSFYEALASFFYDSGFQHRSHKKEDLYRILLLFGASLRPDSPDVWIERVRHPLMEDLAETMNFDAVKKFYKKGWELQWMK